MREPRMRCHPVLLNSQCRSGLGSRRSLRTSRPRGRRHRRPSRTATARAELCVGLQRMPAAPVEQPGVAVVDREILASEQENPAKRRVVPEHEPGPGHRGGGGGQLVPAPVTERPRVPEDYGRRARVVSAEQDRLVRGLGRTPCRTGPGPTGRREVRQLVPLQGRGRCRDGARTAVNRSSVTRSWPDPRRRTRRPSRRESERARPSRPRANRATPLSRPRGSSSAGAGRRRSTTDLSAFGSRMGFSSARAQKYLRRTHARICPDEVRPPRAPSGGIPPVAARDRTRGRSPLSICAHGCD